jgi:L-arabinose isomerase
VGLALRRFLEEGGFDAFSMNFLAFKGAGRHLDSVPFLECCKAMARGIGYAGEGDVLTAALVGALGRGFGRTTFTEIFCPDWKGGSLFLSHMGEINPEVAAARPLVVEKDLPFTGTPPCTVLTCAPAPGPAVFADLVPGPKNTFELLLAPVEVLGDSRRKDMRQSVRGWIRPDRPVAEFLEAYSRAGGTHHSALVLGGSVEALSAFANMAGLGHRVI